MFSLLKFSKFCSGIKARRVASIALFLLGSFSALAFPPAPHHSIYGIVRDEYGHPVVSSDAVIIFTTESGEVRQTGIYPGLRPGVNYEIQLPIDASGAVETYSVDAFRPLVPYQITVRIGANVYLPIQIDGFLNLGQPASDTRLDLTIGVDSDLDSLPDSWENLVISMAGSGLTLADITPNGDLDGDGSSNFDEYQTGTYAWDAMDRISLNILQSDNTGMTIVEFLAIDGRSYTLFGSSDLQNWTKVDFHIQGIDTAGSSRSSYYSDRVHTIQATIYRDPQIKKQAYRLSVD